MCAEEPLHVRVPCLRDASTMSVVFCISLCIYIYIYIYIYIGVGARSACRPGLRGLRAIVISTAATEGGSADDEARKDALLQV